MHEIFSIGNAALAVYLSVPSNTAAVIRYRASKHQYSIQAFKRTASIEVLLKGVRTTLVCRVARTQPLINNNEYQNHYLLFRPSAQPA